MRFLLLALAAACGGDGNGGVAGISIAPVEGLVTSEAGRAATFQILLDVMPESDVTIALSSSDPDEATVEPGMVRFSPSETVSPAALVFTPANWDHAHPIAIGPVDDDLDDGPGCTRS